MNFLKGLALSLLGLLLFLSLSIFGLAYTLNSTVLNPDFVTSEIKSSDISYIAGAFIQDQVQRGGIPVEIGDTLVTTIPKIEPQLKEEVSAAIYPTYDYLLGKSQSLDLAHILRSTVLSSDFVVSVVDKIDISSLAGGFIGQQLQEIIPPILQSYTVKYTNDVVNALEPWIREQVRMAADPTLDYLLGESQSLNVVISLEPVKGTVRDALLQAVLKSPPPELAQVPPTELESRFNELYQLFSLMIPSTFTINESLLGTAQANINTALTEAEGALEQARQYVSDFQLGYQILIGLIVVLILGIILLNHQVRGATRGLAVIFLSVGVPGYVGSLIGKYFMGTRMPELGIPAPLETWLSQFINNLFAPLDMFCLVISIIGLVLLIASFVYRPRQSSV